MRGMEVCGGARAGGEWLLEDMQKESNPAFAAAGGKIKVAKTKRGTTSKLLGTQLDDEAQTKYRHDKVMTRI